MSVIMDALITKEGQANVNLPAAQKEGLFFRDNGFETSSKWGLQLPPRLMKQVLWLLGGFGVGVTTFLVWHFFLAGPKFIPPPPAKLSIPSLKTATQLGGEALLLVEDGKIEEAFLVYEQALALEPNNPSIHNDYGLALLKKNQLATSEIHIRRALAIKADCAPCLNNLGYLKTLTDAPQEAESYLLQAAELEAHYADPYFNLGVLYEKNGDTGNAVNAYQAFLMRLADEKLPIYQETEKHINKLLSKFVSDGPELIE